nr:semaphorin-5A-like isoform X1 [Dermatophagoides farinae]XP_046909278.1 semaphorin-5A-like isoform X1 [Dermatophagoides farinae]
MFFDANRLKLFVGARDHILVLNLKDFTTTNKRDYYIPPTTEKKSKCHMKGMKPEECHNFITTLLEIPTMNYKDKQILVCGTNAYSPECEIRRLTDSFEMVSKSISINSYGPYWNTTSLLTTTGEFFYGGPLDLRGIDSSIFKQKEIVPPKSPLATYLDRRIVRSVQHDSNWISADANFVFSFEFNQHVYFLFRETAVEYLNVGKRVYSRIGRVCKDDPGWRESWTSFLKARINCSLPGSFPFYFDEIQSVDLINYGGTPTLYAIFNTPQNSIHGSAVCAFTMDSVLEAFRGPFKYQPSSSHLWERRDDNHDVFECQVTNTTNQSKSYSTLRLNSKYQQMDDAVQPIDGRPFIFAKNEHFKFIAVDLIKTKYFSTVEVMFVATIDGKLLKYVKWPDMTESCLIDEIQLIDSNENQFLSMQFWKDTESLYFGTEKEFIRSSVHQCHNYHNKDECIQSGDPYCGWHEIKMKCMRPPGNNLRDENWIQSDQPTCLPRWSKWFTCNEADNGLSRSTTNTDETCKCRKRPCMMANNLGDQHCYDGYEYQVSNCTRNGGWSEWTSWSSCMPSCGRGIQYRTRNCNNPIPSNNGKYCSGNDREERQCDNLPYCTWTSWSEWTNCSSDCNIISTSKRTRQCLDFNGNAVDNGFCQGPYIETMKCECKKHIEWTDWFISDLNTNEIVEQRNEIVMHKNNILPKNEQRVVSLKYCDNCGGHTYNFKGKDFLIKECSCDDESIWSDWSEWSICHNDIQIRERVCQLPDRSSCDGHYKEIKFCHSNGVITQRRIENDYRMNWTLLIIAIMLAIILSSGLTAIILIYCFYNNQKHNKPDLMMNHTISSEPNTYEEPEKYRITTPLNSNNNHHNNHYNIPSTLTRVATLKKQTSFRAKLDDSNY